MGLAIVVGIRVIQAQNGWITDDSVLYFEVARLFSQGEWKAGFTLYSWPFYPAIISWLHQLTGLDIKTSAQGLALLFFGLTMYGFCTLLTLCGGNKLAVVSGALILLSSTYIVGDILPMLIRDHGFWSFFMLGLVYFVRFYQSGKLSTAIMWQIAIITAALFRIEAVSFMILLPISLLFDRSIECREKLARIYYAYAVLIVATVLFSLLMFLNFSITTDGLGRLKELISQETYARLWETFSKRSDLMASQVLGSFLEEYATPSLVLSLLLIVVLKSLGTSGLVTVALVLQAFREKFHGLLPIGQRILVWAAGIALLNMLFILMKEFILSGRYIISFSLILMTIAAISLSNLFSSWAGFTLRDRIRKQISIGLLVLLTVGLVSNLLPVRPGHNYEQEAVLWIKQRTTHNDRIFYVSPRARYYAGEPYNGRGIDHWLQVTNAIADGSIHNYDYLVINNKQPEHQARLLHELPDYQLIKIFEGVKGKKRILIFAKTNKKDSAKTI